MTNCFAEDGNPDMRGVEEMFIPLDDPEVDGQFSPLSPLLLLFGTRRY